MPTVTIRPSSTVMSANAVVVGAASIHAALADDSDSTYVTSSYLTLSWRVGVPPPTLPAGARVRHVTPRIRISNGNHYGRFAVAGAYFAGDPPLGELLPSTTPATTYTLTQRARTPAGEVWTADLVHAATLQGSGGPMAVRILAAYLDVLYASRPAVNITAPSGTVDDTTQPTVVHTYTAGADGGPEFRREYRVFTEAQYTDVTFNLEVTGPVASSGVLTGAGNWQINTQLTNGTYRVYMRSAQNVHGAHWSDWTFSTFTIDVALPDPPTLTVTPDSANGRIRIDLTEVDAADHYRMIRSTNGTTWTPVRTMNDGRITSVGATTVIFDYEAAPGTTLYYAARAGLVDNAGNEIAGPWSTASGPHEWGTTDWWIKVPHRPLLSMRVTVTSQPSLGRQRPQEVLSVRGRRDPVVVSDVRASPTGTVAFLSSTEGERRAFDRILDHDGVLLFQAPPSHQWGNRYVEIANAARTRPADTAFVTERIEEWEFVEVAYPSGDVERFGATWDELAAAFTWNELAAAFTDWNDVATWRP
jgi:hypothetical protein